MFRPIAFLLCGFHVAMAGPQPFAIAVVPDVQNYERLFRRDGLDLLDVQMRWITGGGHRPAIAFMSQVGDVTNDNTRAQWDFASAAFKVADQSDMPYSVNFGNHDPGAPGSFPASRYEGKKWFLGASPDGKATAQLFDAGGTAFVHVNIPFNPQAAHYAFAGEMLRRHAGRAAIITTHDYMRDGAPGRSPTGARVWEKLVVPHANVFLVLCGHNWFSRHELDTTADGRAVLQVQSDFQQEADGGGGFLQCLNFDPAAGTVHLTTRSPYSGLALHDPNHDRVFPAKFSATRVEIGPPKDSGDTWLKPSRGTLVNGRPAGTTLGGIQFAVGCAPGTSVSGNPVRLRGQITNLNSGTSAVPSVVDLAIELDGPCEICPGDRVMTLAQPLSGSGDLIKTLGRDAIHGSFDGSVGEGLLTLAAESRHSGVTDVQGGVLKLAAAASANGLAASRRIILRRGSMLDVSAQSGGGITVAPGQELAGCGGVVRGNLILPADSVCSFPLTGFLTVNGAVTIHNARLRIDPRPPHPLSAGPLALIANDGADAVEGVFTADGRPLEEGALAAPGYRITYRGGDGNDIMLLPAK